ncbi:TPA: hypothetical protein ACP7Q5_004883 [Escherichia coli]|jgi:hypothetical protein|uniref:hypothetical protein n=1 Tax=Bacteria TaxID=2 RepID=UPI0024814FDE|nr:MULTISPECIES: hypothetical protein [Bacilli]ELG7158482.1 hypothetical protein [Staphylococcus aureus]HDW3906867.1 hypothetical protein [Escherichia coli]ELL1200938.1 hypothetical protein [Staphylococcus aureus]MDH9287393.1 hypothetical protein [Staphylococcus epidermidis]MDN3085318.1 hypothetical protein [Enterococcus faecalis]
MRSIPSILMYVCAAFNMLYAVAINMGGNTQLATYHLLWAVLDYMIAAKIAEDA